MFLGLGPETRSVTPLPGPDPVEIPASEYGIAPGSLYVSVTAFF